MTITVQWYERKPDFSADYTKEHHGSIKGSSAAECMLQFSEFKLNHDLSRYTIPAIVWVYD